MKTARTFLFSALALLSLSTHARAQTAAPPATPTAPAAGPGAGSLDGPTYTNEYFGLTLTLPAGWSVQGEAVKKEFGELGKKMLDTKDPAKQAQLERAVENTLSLLAAMQYPADAPRPAVYNPGFLCVAEKIPAAAVAAGATDADYMALLKNTFKYSRVPITVERDVYTEPVGGRTFSVIDVRFDFPQGVARQRYYAHLTRGYALGFVLSYQTPEQLAVQTEVVKSVRFR